MDSPEAPQERSRKFRRRVLETIEAGIEQRQIFTLVETTPDDPEGLTLQEIMSAPNPVQLSQDFARAEYRKQNIPQGHRRWVRKSRRGKWIPWSADLGSTVDYPDFSFESDLWRRLGKEEGSSAWAAGEILKHAEHLDGLMNPEIAGILERDGQGDTHREAIAYEAFQLGRAYDVLFAKVIPQDAGGNSAERLMRAAKGSARGPRERLQAWLQAFAPAAQSYCDSHTDTNVGGLVRFARDWDAEARKTSRGHSLPDSDRAIRNGILKLEKLGKLTIPNRAKREVKP